MKKFLAIIMATILCLSSLCVAVSVSAVEDMPLSLTVNKGEDGKVIVAVQAKQAFDFATLEAHVTYDESVFTREGNGTFNDTYDMGYVQGTDGFMMSAKNVDIEPYMDNVPAGTVLVTYEFTCADDIAEGEYSFTLNLTTMENGDFESILPTETSVTATFTIFTEPVYTAGLTTLDSAAAKNGTVTVKVGVSHTTDEFFNAAEIVLNYDSAKLELNSVASSAQSQQELQYTNNNGVLTIHEFGEDKGFSTSNYTIVFTAKAIGEAKIELESAKFVHKANANKSDLIEATLGTDELTIEITQQTFAVTLPDENITGNTVAGEGDDYVISVADYAHYNYTLIVKVNGYTIDAANLINNENGTYTVKGAAVKGAIEILYTRTARSYNVHWYGTGKDDITDKSGTAIYGVDFTFTLPEDKEATAQEDGHYYVIESVRFDGVGCEYSLNEETRVCTIPGTAITGTLSITVKKVSTSIEKFSVTVVGDASDATVVATPVVKFGEASITLTPELGYTYTVTATMGNESATVTGSNNTYTVMQVTGNVIFTVTKTLIKTGVQVYDYVAGMHLVTFAPTLAEGKVPTYNGNVMYYSEKYAAYCWLVKDETLTAEAATAMIGAVTGEATNVNYSMDINLTTKLDAADAQLVWNMYNGMYLNFETVTMAQFLAADQNAVSGNTSTYGLSVNDALVIINAILNNTAQ